MAQMNPRDDRYQEQEKLVDGFFNSQEKLDNKFLRQRCKIKRINNEMITPLFSWLPNEEENR